MRTASLVKIGIQQSLAFGLAFGLASSAYAGPPPSPSKKGVTMTSSKKCKSDNVHRSKCMIELMLEDIAATYNATGGGGISNIKALTSTSYSVSLPQEERIDVLTYEFNVAADGTVVITRKVPSTTTPRR